ncbi:1-aminocyclopropane-1-carboxylate oxidase homolog 10-like [Rhodamnia argentea]|uniref:1-aminocyclopropane-1-carboxylate oxidase homolog 10-like n=1 Tax=Rhodamnia argentea TaxID=178133 RepID=A0ABM3HA51_9MYRT|nr:1-aminocyclopropane-1-carboxylate oxidase homolog 10-like [Rhodamnia argentea]
MTCFLGDTPLLYGTIKELTSQTTYQSRKETTLPNYTTYYVSKGLDGASALPDFKSETVETSEDGFESNSGSENLSIPIIDLGQIDRDPTKRREGIKRMRRASEMLGFFQVVNPGVSKAVMGKEEGFRRFHEQDDEAKKVLHTRDMMRKVMYSSNFDPNTTSMVN